MGLGDTKRPPANPDGRPDVGDAWLDEDSRHWLWGMFRDNWGWVTPPILVSAPRGGFLLERSTPWSGPCCFRAAGVWASSAEMKQTLPTARWPLGLGLGIGRAGVSCTTYPNGGQSRDDDIRRGIGPRCFLQRIIRSGRAEDKGSNGRNHSRHSQPLARARTIGVEGRLRNNGSGKWRSSLWPLAISDP